ncbi:hypothetical protein GCM10027212_19700 [Actinotalea caeni]
MAGITPDAASWPARPCVSSCVTDSLLMTRHQPIDSWGERLRCDRCGRPVTDADSHLRECAEHEVTLFVIGRAS